MAVLRISHQENYVVISKQVLEDHNLSFKAKGLWAYCMSRPNDWVFHVKHLATISKDKEDSIYSAIKELEREGYVQKVQKNENGKFGSVDYIISETKIKINTIKEILPLRDFPDAGLPDTENPALLSNEYTNPSSLQSEVKEQAARTIPSGGAAAPSFEEKIMKNKAIPESEKEAALSYVKANPDKFKSADNPMGLLVTIVRSGDHKRGVRDPKIIERRKAWSQRNEWSGPAGYRVTGKGGVIVVSGSKQIVYKWDSNDDFLKLIGLGFEDGES